MESTIRQRQQELDRAELTADAVALEDLLADDFLSIGPRGFVMTKDEWIGRHVHFSYQSLDTSEVDVRMYDGAAIVRNVQHNLATYRDQHVDITARVSQVWVDLDGRWRLAGIQFSPMSSG